MSTTDPSLSPLITVADCCGNPSSPYKFLSHVASRPASDNATYSASVEDSAITDCFLDFQVIALVFESPVIGVPGPLTETETG